ncbi:MAG: hypothetical protein AB7L13_24965 [Acidimicrobiia bacterium]
MARFRWMALAAVAIVLSACGDATDQSDSPSSTAGLASAEATREVATTVETRPPTTKAPTTTTAAPTTMTSTTRPSTTSMAAPTTTTLPPQAPLHFEGVGDSVVALDGLTTRAVILRIAHDGASNIAVWAYTPNGERDSLLVNDIGAYSGTVMFEPYNLADPVPNILEIETDGFWTIDVAPVAEATPWDGRSPIAGVGDSVVWIPFELRATSLTKVALANDGNSNFVVLGISTSRNIELMVNDIGPYTGASLMKPGTAILIVTAEGGWSANPG